ncbi:rna-directed dna polymerase from mobile element jockey- hypothetical protein [Limosa lapponica baueri]|uniref:Rna-directed dna polymerase from mobile element jockey-like n=1 Tax=Limosa lapponica baueri TaxID=1758121 RepID=A0A2I0UPE2_LIMLA|nr:rna-directed dna polymerase from mobile element jockey- hypothetical protein [Limosa lapponica baueri]
MSKLKPVMSGVPQESVLRSIPFNIFINDIDIQIECNLSNIKLSGPVHSLEGRDAIQKDPNWAHANLMKFNKAKHKVLQLGHGYPPISVQTG